jgi:serine/threonine-protein kinase
MGRVYEARRTRIRGKRFAVKLLHPEYAREPQILARFQREAEAMAMLKSPHVVEVVDVDRTADGRPFIVSEFLEGKELAELLLSQGKMPIGPAIRIVRQILRALRAAHAKGIVHRDMKPENVFLIGDLAQPRAKVLDFGISKVKDAPGTALTKTGMIMGTPAYMSPEQALGREVDHRTDIYAVGAILYHALTGRRPFEQDDPMATLSAVISEDPPRPRLLDPAIPEPLELVIQRAMAKRAGDRHASVDELSAELAPYDPGEAALAPAGGAGAPAAGALARGGAADRRVSLARPLIVLLGAVGVSAAATGVAAAVAGIMRLTGGGGAAHITGTEATFLVVGLACALLLPVILAARHVRRRIWGNSARAVALAERLARPVAVGLCAVGFAELLIRFMETVVLRGAAGLAWPVWDLLLFVMGGVAAAGAYVMHAAELKRQGG